MYKMHTNAFMWATLFFLQSIFPTQWSDHRDHAMIQAQQVER